MFLQSTIDPAYEDISELEGYLRDKKDYLFSSDAQDSIFEDYCSADEVLEDALSVVECFDQKGDEVRMRCGLNRFISDECGASQELFEFLEELDIFYMRSLERLGSLGTAHAYGLNTGEFVAEADGVSLKDERFRAENYS